MNGVGEVYEFEGVRVDVPARLVWHGQRRLALTNKAFELLVYLMTRPGWW